MDLSFIFMQFLSGLTMATLLFLVASGLTLIFGVGNVFNFAHGSFFMVGAYLAYQAVSAWHTHFWPAILVAALGAGILGMLAESLFLRRIYGRAEEGGFQILLTYSFILVIDDLVKLIWGTEYKSLQRPAGLTGSIEVGSLTIPAYNLAIIGIGLVVVVLAWLILSRTRSGRIARAAAVDREMLGSMGVNVPLTMTLVFGIATAMGGFAGGLAAPLRSVTPGAGIEVIIDSLIVVVIGGMGNFWGAWLGALILGEVNAFGVATVPEWASLFNYLVMVLTLIFKPEGLFAPRRIRKV
ncbi:MAG TPA: branched-chain amino acid ABC transporter permease [Desulfomonilaceae bacterium]|nr:branched-chain amino acid ABC transporter permease [Desulfomonilaceae bacterium]